MSRNIFYLTICALIPFIWAYPQGQMPADTEGLSGVYKGAVVSNGLECAKIGGKILKEGGSAVDAAIAILFCEGVTGPQSMGIGGGFLATIYDHKTGEVRTLNAREAAPKNSSEMMFADVDGPITGGHASAIPSEMKGYSELYKKYGKLPWKRLVEPTISLCLNGHKVDKFLASVLDQYKERIMSEPTIKEIFVNETGNVYKKYDLIRRPKLAETLRIIADNGVEEFYGGELGRKFIEDVRSMGGVLTLEDLKNYEVKWGEPITNKLNDDLTMYSMPLPGSGAVLSLILNIVKDRLEKEDSVAFHRIVESFKHAYALRTNLSDDAFNENALKFVQKALSKEYASSRFQKIDDSKTFNTLEYYGAINPEETKDHGTANIAVLAPNGDAITVTSTINNVFGAFKRSPQTGIILNDEMDDFSTPGKINAYGYHPSPLNYIKPGKRPLSSMNPTIVLDKDKNVRLLIGAAGGSQITSSVALTMIRHLVFHKSLNESINTPRFHHQLLPMKVQIQPGFDNELTNEFKKLGHDVIPVFPLVGFSAVTGIAVDLDVNEVHPVYDERRGGSYAIYDVANNKLKGRSSM